MGRRLFRDDECRGWSFALVSKKILYNQCAVDPNSAEISLLEIYLLLLVKAVHDLPNVPFVCGRRRPHREVVTDPGTIIFLLQPGPP